MTSPQDANEARQLTHAERWGVARSVARTRYLRGVNWVLATAGSLGAIGLGILGIVRGDRPAEVLATPEQQDTNASQIEELRDPPELAAKVLAAIESGDRTTLFAAAGLSLVIAAGASRANDKIRTSTVRHVESLRPAVGRVEAQMSDQQIRDDIEGNGVRIQLRVTDPTASQVDVFVGLPQISDGRVSGIEYRRITLDGVRATGDWVDVPHDLESSGSPREEGFGGRRAPSEYSLLAQPAVVALGYTTQEGHRVQQWFAGSGIRPGSFVDGIPVGGPGAYLGY